MKIEFFNDPNIIEFIANDNKSIIIIPFKVEFINKTSALLKTFSIKFNEKDIRYESSILCEDNAISLPFPFDKTKHSNETFKLKIELKNHLESNELNLHIYFGFEFNNESVANNEHFLTIRKNKHDIELVVQKKIHNRTSYINLCFILMIAVIFNIWNAFNIDVFNQPWWFTPVIIGQIGTFILIFLGVEIRQLAKFVKTLPKLENFIINPEFYIQPTLLKKLRSEYTTVILFLILFISCLFIFYFTPMTLPEIDKKLYSYYIDDKIVLTKKVYRFEVKKIIIGLNKELVSKEFVIIPIARCYDNDLFEITNNFINYSYYRNCNFVGDPKYSSKLIIEKIIENPSSDLDSMILSRLKGKQNKIVFMDKDTCFCDDKDGEFKSGGNRIESDVFSSISVVQLLQDFQVENKQFAKELWDKADYSVEYNLKIDEYVHNFTDYYNKYMGKTKRPTDSDIMQCYDEIVNNISSSGRFKPFYDEKSTTTFDKILQLILLFNVSSIKPDCNKLCNDFIKYINVSKGASKISGLGGIGDRVITLYIYLLTSIHQLQIERNDNTIITTFNEVIENSKNKQQQLEKGHRNNEEAVRHTLIRSLFFQSAFYNFKLTDYLKNIFINNSSSLITDQNLKNKINNLKGMNEYNIFLNEIHKKYNNH